MNHRYRWLERKNCTRLKKSKDKCINITVQTRPYEKHPSWLPQLEHEQGCIRTPPGIEKP